MGSALEMGSQKGRGHIQRVVLFVLFVEKKIVRVVSFIAVLCNLHFVFPLHPTAFFLVRFV